MSLRSAACVLAVTTATASVAEPYDIQLTRLGNPFAGGAAYRADANANFRAFASQMSAAINSAGLTPADTTGHAGFAISADVAVIDFGSGTGALPLRTPLRGPMLLPSIHLRKGLPFSFELGIRGGWIEKSGMWMGTAEVRWALSEGFRVLPELAVRAHVSRLLNSGDFQLLTGGLDVGLGKRLTVGGRTTLTPYLGWNLLLQSAWSGLVDFRPERPLGDSEAPSTALRDTATFTPTRAFDNMHHRLYAGLRMTVGPVTISGEFSYTLFPNFTDADTGGERTVPRVLSGNASLGFAF